MTSLTPQIIRNTAKEARSNHATPLGNCYSISHRFQELLNTWFHISADVVETQIGEIRDTHFINKLPATHYADSDDYGDILIDASLDQFCTENQHHDDIRVDLGPRNTLPHVAIYPPGTEERALWYYRPNDPREGHDVFTGESLDH